MKIACEKDVKNIIGDFFPQDFSQTEELLAVVVTSSQKRIIQKAIDCERDKTGVDEGQALTNICEETGPAQHEGRYS